MGLLKELEKVGEGLKQQRDEIKVQLHLASLEAKAEWENTEKKLSLFKEKIADIGDDTKETTEEFVEATKVIGEEIKAAYKRIVERLED